MAALSADDRVRLWLLTQVRAHVPLDAHHLHYRDCPQLKIYEYEATEEPLSSVTLEIWTHFVVIWGCAHGAERIRTSITWHDGLGELIDELADIENASVEVKQDFAIEEIEQDSDPLFSRHYPAPGGTVYVPEP